MKAPLGLWLVALAALVVLAAPKWQQAATERLMRHKRDASHKLLDAVILEDYETLGAQAFRLRALAETADWNVLDTETYATLSRSFVEATQNLVQAAEEKNGSQAALAYLEMTLQCVGCHRYVKSALGEAE